MQVVNQAGNKLQPTKALTEFKYPEKNTAVPNGLGF
jgi:hypothetical protein